MEFNGRATVRVTIENRGVAPFYHDGWTARLQLVRDRAVVQEFMTKWSPQMVQPGQQESFEQSIDFNRQSGQLAATNHQIQLIFPNPMQTGKPIRFANENCDPQTGALSIGTLAAAR